MYGSDACGCTALHLSPLFLSFSEAPHVDHSEETCLFLRLLPPSPPLSVHLFLSLLPQVACWWSGWLSVHAHICVFRRKVGALHLSEESSQCEVLVFCFFIFLLCSLFLFVCPSSPSAVMPCLPSFVYLSVCLPILTLSRVHLPSIICSYLTLPVCLLCVSASMSVPASVSVSASHCLSLPLCLCMSLPVSVSVSSCLCVCVCVCFLLYLSVSVSLFASVPVCSVSSVCVLASVLVSVCLCLVCLSVSLSVCVCLCAYVSLSAPNPDDPLANDVAEHWKKDEAAAIRTARDYTRKYATGK